MSERLIILLGTALLLFLPMSSDVLAQNQQQQRTVQPTPRWPDGRVNLGTASGEKGHWIRTRRQLVVDSLVTNPLPNDLNVRDIPFQPWAKALFDYRRGNDNRDSPHARCKPSAGPRQINTAYGFEIMDFPAIQRVLIFDIGGPQSFRMIRMNESHPQDLKPTPWGHSIGRWENDTLVVDSIGFDEGTWVDIEGLVHTDQYHQVERFTRTDFNTLKYEVTVDDPGAYTAPWTAGFNLRWNAGAELFEFICQDNNMNSQMTINDEGEPLSRATNAFTP